MNIDYIGLESFLKTLEYKDFQELKKIKTAHTVDDIVKFGHKGDIEPETVVNFGEFFLVDFIGNDLTIVSLTKRKYKNPKGRMVRAKIVKTIIHDCKEQYGSCLNGYWSIPKRFVK